MYICQVVFLVGGRGMGTEGGVVIVYIAWYDMK